METILEYAFGVIYQILNNKSKTTCQHFLGGSRRFGYFNKNSDYDIFVTSSHPGILEVLNQGFKEVHVDSSDYKFSVHYRMPIGSSHIDMVVVPDRHFHQLLEEHAKIEMFIDENKNMIQFIKSLKRLENVSGSRIYKTLISSYPV